jgi:amino acid efflux transporter
MTTPRATALYVGALLGPSLLLLPGLAAQVAGPASVLAWAGLLVLSGLLATVFTALGTRFGSAAGAAGYVRAAFGERAGQAVAWCFLSGVICGAPVVCLIGGNYVAALVGGSPAAGIAVAALLLLTVLGTTLAGARAGGMLQLALVAVLVALVAVAVAGAAPHARTASWTPFAPHGWGALGSAASLLMMSFVGWEAIAPLTTRLSDPVRQLPRVTAAALLVTSVVYLALAGATIGVLGPDAGSAVPLSRLLEVAIGRPGPAVAAVAAVAVTLAATNAYITGATEMAADLTAPPTPPPPNPTPPTPRECDVVLTSGVENGSKLGTTSHSRGWGWGRGWGRGRGRGLQVAIGVAGFVVLGAAGLGAVGTAQLVALPTSLFLAVYLATTAAAVRILTRATRVVAAVACLVTAAVTAFAGWALVVPTVIFGWALVGSGAQRAAASSALRAMSARAARWAAASR